MLEEAAEIQKDVIILNRKEMTAEPGKDIPGACSEGKRKG